MQPPKEQPALHVSADLFRQHKLRIEKIRRIAADLKSGNRQRIEELRDMEATSVQRPEQAPPGAITRKEEFIDACGWYPCRIRMRYVSPDGEKLEEVVMLFLKLPAQWLTCGDGENASPYIPADLFDAKLVSHKHAVPAPHRKCEIRMIPRVDDRGAYLGVYSVMIDVP